MPESHYPCSIDQAFNFQKTSQEIVGHVTSLSIGGTAYTADLNVTVPTDLSTAKVVGVMSSVYWHGGYADPMQLDFNVSVKNQPLLSVLKHTTLSKTDVEICFNVYKYDPNNKVFYLAFHTNGSAVKGLILESGGNLEFEIFEAPDTTVASPLNFPMRIAVMPNSTQQEIQMAFSNSDKVTKQWGVKVE